VVCILAARHPAGANVRCTHVTIPQAAETLAVVLSRPAWLWGCEMGANECGVVGGNEAVHSLLARELGTEPRLLGMDLLRLALERARTARDAVGVCAALLEAHGQGGACSDDGDGWTYENGFLFADATEAFVLETAGVRHWASERVPPGRYRNISNGFSIRTELFACSAQIQQLCKAKGWWGGTSPFDWKAAVAVGGRAHARLELAGRERSGNAFLAQASSLAAAGELGAEDAVSWLGWMAGVLRDEESGICFRDVDGFCSTGSQISWLPPPTPPGAGAAGAAGAVAVRSPAAVASHLFTASSDPVLSAYKRFAFGSSRSHGPSDHGSRALWQCHRERALAAQHGDGDEAPAGEVRTRLREIEAQAMRESAAVAAAGVADGGPTSDNDDRPGAAFERAIRAELELLRRAV
jgi:secernin